MFLFVTIFYYRLFYIILVYSAHDLATMQNLFLLSIFTADDKEINILFILATIIHGHID